MKQKKIYQLVTEAKPWFSDLSNRGLSDKTIEGLDGKLSMLAGYLERTAAVSSPSEVTKEQLASWREWLNESGYHFATIAAAVGAARGYFGWLFQRGFLFTNPAEHLQAPRYFRPMQYVPTEAAMKQLFLSICDRKPLGLRDRALFEVAYSTGLRISEMTALTLDAVDFTHRTIRAITKGRRERVLPLTQAAVSSLQAYLSDARPQLARDTDSTNALWLGERGRPLGLQAIQYTARQRGMVIGIPLTMHAIRRAFATHLLLNGASVAEVKELLGHSSYQHMQHYIRYAPEELRAIHRRSKLGK